MRWPYCNARHVLLQSGSRQQVTGRGCLCRAQTGIPPVAESSAGNPAEMNTGGMQQPPPLISLSVACGETCACPASGLHLSARKRCQAACASPSSIPSQTMMRALQCIIAAKKTTM